MIDSKLARAALLLVASFGTGCLREYRFDRDAASDIVSTDTTSDSSTDVTPLDASDAIDDVDAGPPVDGGPAPGIPRLVYPLSTSRITGSPTAIVQAPSTGNVDKIEVQLCSKIDCSTANVITSVLSAGAPDAFGQYTVDLSTLGMRSGAIYWRARAISLSGVAGEYTAPWLMYRVNASASQSRITGSVYDFDLDGFPDVAVGAAAALPGGSAGTGEVHFYRTTSTGLVYFGSIPAPASSLQFGQEIASIGDVNGDGYPDLAVSATDGMAYGYVHVYFGNAGPPSSWIANTTLSGPSNELYGNRVAGLGDVNGDGYADIGVGRPSADFGGATTDGAVDVEFGSPAGLGTAGRTSLDCRTTGMCADSHFGLAIMSLGDMDGDRFADFAVGGPVGSSGGFVHVYRGLNDMAGLHDNIAQSFGVSTTATSDSGTFGAHLGAGDANGDGIADLLVSVSAPSARAYLYLGSSAAMPLNLTPIAFTDPTGNGNSFGSSYAVLERESGSGPNYIAIGDPMQNRVTVVALVSGVPSSLIHVTGPTASMSFGTAVARLSDITGDGLDELVTAYPATATSANAGHLLYYSPPTMPTCGSTACDIASPATGDAFGYNIAASY